MKVGELAGTGSRNERLPITSLKMELEMTLAGPCLLADDRLAAHRAAAVGVHGKGPRR